MTKINIEDLSEKELEVLIEEVGSKLFLKRTSKKPHKRGLKELELGDFQEFSDYNIEGEETTLPDATSKNFIVAIEKINELVRYVKRNIKEGDK